MSDNMEINIKLSANEWNVVLHYLANGKYLDVVQIISKIKEQGENQVNNNSVIVDPPKE